MTARHVPAPRPEAPKLAPVTCRAESKSERPDEEPRRSARKPEKGSEGWRPGPYKGDPALESFSPTRRQRAGIEKALASERSGDMAAAAAAYVTVLKARDLNAGEGRCPVLRC